MKAIWITWEQQRRNESMAVLLDAKHIELLYSGNRLFRYFVLSFQTWRTIRRETPEIVFFQNPSIVLAGVITVVRGLSRRSFQIVGDYHNSGVYPPIGKNLVKPLSRLMDLILVSNDNLAAVVEAWGCSAMAFPDPLPQLGTASPASLKETRQALFICSWATDEPIAEVIQAAGALPDTSVLITGKPNFKRYPTAKESPPNVTLTGFLSRGEFDSLLQTCDIVIDLTTRDDCMVCGAYEGVAAGKPLILSDNPPSRDYFTQGTLFTDNSVGDLAANIKQAFDEIEMLTDEARRLRADLEQRDASHKRQLYEKLAEIPF